jgi:hypothetical protein
MLYWMALTAKEARGSQSLEAIAQLAEVSVGSLRAFERGNSWPQAARMDRVLAAYATASGIDDARKLWRRALSLWEIHGEPPHLNLDDRMNGGSKPPSVPSTA